MIDADRLDWHRALAAYNRGIERARDEYASHPITSPSHPCATCSGHGYGPGGQCIKCQKEDQ